MVTVFPFNGVSSQYWPCIKPWIESILHSVVKKLFDYRLTEELVIITLIVHDKTLTWIDLNEIVRLDPKQVCKYAFSLVFGFIHFSFPWHQSCWAAVLKPNSGWLYAALVLVAYADSEWYITTDWNAMLLAYGSYSWCYVSSSTGIHQFLLTANVWLINGVSLVFHQKRPLHTVIY